MYEFGLFNLLAGKLTSLIALKLFSVAVVQSRMLGFGLSNLIVASTVIVANNAVTSKLASHSDKFSYWLPLIVNSKLLRALIPVKAPKLIPIFQVFLDSL